MGLALASLLGAVYVVAAIAVVFYAVPRFWAESVAPQLATYGTVSAPAKWAVQIAALVGLVWFGRKLLGNNPPRGISGGIFLTLLAVTVTFFVWRWFAMSLEGGAGTILAGVAAAFCVLLTFRLLTGRTGERWMVGLEEQGWFSSHSYKRSLGQRARRLTILGFLLVGGSGVYSLMFSGQLPENWVISLPFEEPNSFTLLPDARFTVPILLIGLTLWFAWRAVNLPVFAEFLIATEAEMNKVSWTPKKRLGQDTVVVLTTTLLLALFLLVVDLFWGWLLSNSWVGVLPAREANTAKDKAAERARW